MPPVTLQLDILRMLTADEHVDPLAIHRRLPRRRDRWNYPRVLRELYRMDEAGLIELRHRTAAPRRVWRVTDAGRDLLKRVEGRPWDATPR